MNGGGWEAALRLQGMRSCLPGRGRCHDHEGGFPRAGLVHCTGRADACDFRTSGTPDCAVFVSWGPRSRSPRVSLGSRETTCFPWCPTGSAGHASSLSERCHLLPPGGWPCVCGRVRETWRRGLWLHSRFGARSEEHSPPGNKGGPEARCRSEARDSGAPFPGRG